MNIQEIKKLHRSQPFKPFTLRLADGNEYTVRHPEFFMVTESGRTIIVATPDDSFEIIDALLVASIHVANGQHEDAKSDDSNRE